jgi:hypothetical protein
MCCGPCGRDVGGGGGKAGPVRGQRGQRDREVTGQRGQRGQSEAANVSKQSIHLARKLSVVEVDMMTSNTVVCSTSYP